jgi:pSer/pThr/pTyr-binding forkhead associated (FHA) protein
MKVHLVHLSPSQTDTIVIDHFPCIVGRSSSCDRQVFHPMVSRKHCEFVAEAEGVKIQDLHSSNGTYVNGHRVKETAVLRDGDEINIACVSYRVAVEPAVN